MRVTNSSFVHLPMAESSHETQEADSKHASLDLSVIIPFTRAETVDSTIESVLRQSYPDNLYEIIVVGKGSSRLIDRWKGITAVETEVLHSPGKARNLGAAHASGKFLLFLDDDCEVQTGWIYRNLEELGQDPVGAVSGRILGKNGGFIPRSVDFANFGYSQTNKYREGRLWTATFGIRNSVFASLGGFDESIEVHEDIDFCFRLWQRGYKTVYQPAIKVLHNHGRSTIGELIRYQYSRGKKAGLRVEARYPDASLRNKILAKLQSPFLYLVALAPMSVLGTLSTIWVNFREQPSTLLLSPLILAGKLSCHFGIFRNLLSKKFRGEWRHFNAIQNFRRLVEYSTLRRFIRTPRVLTLFVTSQCNAKCGHCFYWQELNQSTDLSTNELQQLSLSIGKIDKLLISGGEPFLCRDLPVIIRSFFENNDLNFVSIPTNGLLPDLIQQQTREILKASDGRAVNVSFSVDGMADIHDELRGVPGNFQKVIESYEALLELQKEFGNLSLRVNSTVMNRTLDSITNLIDEFQAYFPETNTPALSLLRGSPFDRTLELPSTDNLRQLHKRKRTTNPGKQPWIWRLADWATYHLALETIERETQVVPCEAGKLLGVVEANGNVKHCELLPPIGNLREGSFIEIWESESAQAEREKIINKECQCTHECNLFPSALAHPIKGAAALVKAAVASDE